MYFSRIEFIRILLAHPINYKVAIGYSLSLCLSVRNPVTNLSYIQASERISFCMFTKLQKIDCILHVTTLIQC